MFPHPLEPKIPKKQKYQSSATLWLQRPQPGQRVAEDWFYWFFWYFWFFQWFCLVSSLSPQVGLAKELLRIGFIVFFGIFGFSNGFA